MYVIGHHTPRMQDVAPTIKVEQSDFDDFSKTFISKKAGTVAAIKKILNPLSPFEIGPFFLAGPKFFSPTFKD